MRLAPRALIAAAPSLLALIALSPSAGAMPVFAKAYGLKCSACHTAVPALNAYGRYIQRSGYASLERDVLKDHLPFWLGEQVNGDSAGGVNANAPTATNSFGNAAIHAAGYITPDVTYHVQQWLIQNDQTGGSLDTAWFTFNNLFHHDGHLFVGKIEAPGPSPFSQWFDISPFSTPEMTVGEHAWQLDGNRWGTKLGYTHDAWSAEAGYLLSGNGLPTSADFDVVPGTEKTFQWHVTHARGEQPLEIGAYGSNGTFKVSTGDTDIYSSVAAYLQNDPNRYGVPGILAIYQLGKDSNPGLDSLGNQLPSATSHAISAELYEPFLNDNAAIGVRTEIVTDGLGNITRGNNVDLTFQVPHYQYLHAYVEAGLGAHSATPNGTPDWRWMLWWTTPLGK